MQHKRTVFIPLSRVRPGQRFLHHGQEFRRADDDEIRKHPGRENPRYTTRGDVVLAYGRGPKDQSIPVTFVETERVIVPGR